METDDQTTQSGEGMAGGETEPPAYGTTPERMAPGFETAMEPGFVPAAETANTASPEDVDDSGNEGAAPEPEEAAPSPEEVAPAPPTHRVEIGRVDGDLTIYGTTGSNVIIKSGDDDDDDEDDDDYRPEEDTGHTIRFNHLPGDTEIHAPAGTVIAIRSVSGDLTAEGMAGMITIYRINGDAELRDIEAADLRRVDGDVSASGCGDLRLPDIGGEARLEGLRATALVGRVGGELNVRDAPGLEARESIGGDATIEGCTEDVVIRGPVGGDLRAENCAGHLAVGTVGGDLRVRMVAALTVDGGIGGSCDIAEIAGPADLRGSVSGSLHASLVGALSLDGSTGGSAEIATIGGPVRLRTVGGGLRVDALAGPLSAGAIGGDARLRNCLGPIGLRVVGGDLTAKGVAGGLLVERVGGDAELDTPLGAGAEYQVRAGGDVVLRVRGEVNARFVAQTRGGEVHSRLPLAVERGRRRNLVGVLGRGDAAVTLFSDGGDISIAASGNEEDTMGDEFTSGGSGANPSQGGTDSGASERHWEGAFGGHRFRVHWDPGMAGTATEDPDGIGAAPHRGIKFEWEHHPERDREAMEDFERRMDDLREKAEHMARKAADQAQRYAERAARRARETDWESVGREVRSAIERAMSDLEGAVGQVRREYETRRGPGGFGGFGGPRPNGPGAAGPRPGGQPGAQRVRIERDEDEGDAYASGYGAPGGPSAQGSAAWRAAPGAAEPGGDVESRRRAILEQLRAGTISLDDAERQLAQLR
ncbi:MAG TPA: hypothetical protein VIC85_00625 [Ktedonobacterales bacterium]|jgi:hypothetical protein